MNMSQILLAILAVVLSLAASLQAFDRQVASADEVYNANPKPPTDGLVGTNYTPAYAVNQVQFWHDFRPKVVEKELAAAQKHFGISTLRVYLHNINFDEENKVFMANLEKFMTICDKHRSSRASYSLMIATGMKVFSSINRPNL